MNIGKRISFVWPILFVLILVFAGYILLSSGNKQSHKVYRVGVLSGLNFLADITDGFKEKMTELGYVEGKDIVYDVQKTDVDIAAYNRILKKFIDDKVDLIFVFPTEASIEAKAATQGTDIPVVFANVFTEDTGLVNSVREPGGNITGVRWAGPDMARRSFEIMRQLVPKAKHVWIPYLKDYPIVNSQLEALRSVLKDAGLTMAEIPAENATELETAIKEQTQSTGPPDAIMTLAEPLCVTPDTFVVLAKFADEHKIPLGGPPMSVGGYESVYGLKPENVPQGKQAAFLADKILKGTPPGTIPVISAENYFILNYKKAQKLGLNMPEGLLSRADEITR
jgi:putative ABC transport system substrate-binding protein